MQSGIYLIANTVNGKRYVGSAVDLKKRWYDHQRHLNNGTHSNVYLQRSWSKFGSQVFKFLILERCAKKCLIKREQFYIDTLRPEINICLVAGSTLGFRFSAESRAKMSARAKITRIGNKNAFGNKHTEETRAKLSAMLIGNKRLLGKKHSNETRAKMRESRLRYFETLRQETSP